MLPAPSGSSALCQGRAAAASRSKGSCWEAACERYPLQAVQDTATIVGLCKLFATVTIFWALFDQHASTWTYQARQTVLLHTSAAL